MEEDEKTGKEEVIRSLRREKRRSLRRLQEVEAYRRTWNFLLVG